jgi:hypothetical protein
VSSGPNAASAMSLQFPSNKAVGRISAAYRKIANGQGKPLPIAECNPVTMDCVARSGI